MSSASPLVVYIPNSPYVYYSNISTFDPSYNVSERNAIVQNGYQVATMANGTRDAMWPVCVGCAVLERSLGRTGTAVPQACQDCFSRYCWDGTLNSTVPNVYEPVLVGQPVDVKGGATGLRGVNWVLAGVVVLAGALLL